MKPLLFTFSLIAIFLYKGNLSGEEIKNSKNNKSFDITQDDACCIYNNAELELISDFSLGKPNSGMYYYEVKYVSFRNSVRIKLNNRNGVEKFSNFTLTSIDAQYLKSCQITCYKPNGLAIEYDSTKILSSLVPSSNQNLKMVKFIIPDTQAGDELEINYTCEYPGGYLLSQKLNGNIFPTKEIPSLKSKYTIAVPAPYRVFYKCYNNYREPTIKTDNVKAICTFSADSIPAVKDALYGCPSRELPYFYYSVEYNKNSGDFIKLGDLYNEFIKGANFPLDPYASADYVKKWVRKNLDKDKNLTKFQQFEKLYSIILNEFEISDQASIDDFTAHKIRKIDLYRFYVQIFNFLKIDYFVCLAKNKYVGDIDTHFIRKNEITDYLLMYYDNDGKQILIYPHETYRKYYLNEFPTYLNGTYAFMIKHAKEGKKNRLFVNSKVSSDSLLIIEKIFLLMGNEKSNYYLRQRFIGVDLKSDLSSYWSILNYSGLSSTESRPFYENILNSNENYTSYLREIQRGRDLFKIDSIYLKNENKKPPYNYSIGMSGKLGKFFNFIDDTTVVISLNEILNNNKIEYEKASRNLDIFLPYAFSDIQDLVIDFKQPVDIINLEILQKNLDNSIGTYKFETVPVEKTKLHLTSTYSIKKELIDKASFKDLDEINEASGQMSNSKLILRIKK